MAGALTEPKAAASGEPPTPGAEPSPTPATLAPKADDLEAIRAAVVDSAGISTGLWLSYLFVLFYLLVAAGGVTHRDLFFESPVKLPFLNIDLPLKGFFCVGPALFLIVHVYVLVHFAMLAGKVRIFDIELRAKIEDPEVRTRRRWQLPSNIFVQFLAGPGEIRDGIMGLLLWLITLISLVIAPVALLVFFQLQFLPYHDPWITWWHRIAVLFDLILLWLLWPPISRGQTTLLNWTDLKSVRVAIWLPRAFCPCFGIHHGDLPWRVAGGEPAAGAPHSHHFWRRGLCQASKPFKPPGRVGPRCMSCWLLARSILRLRSPKACGRIA
jgi:hypothetical protein